MKNKAQTSNVNVIKQNKVNKKGTLIVLNILAAIMVAGGFLGAIIMSLIFALNSMKLVPYYSFWPFVGFILVTLFGLIFMAICLTVTRKKSKHSFRYQMVAVLVAFFCLTVVFGVLMDTVFPDIIDMATQGTLHTEDLYNNSEKQSETNAKLVRDFIVANLLNGSYGGEDVKYSYHDMSQYVKGEGNVWTDNFVDADIRNGYQRWKNIYETQPSMYGNYLANLSGLKKELFDFIYNTYIFTDSDYALNGGDKAYTRQCVTLAMCDKAYPMFEYLCKEGIKKGNRTEYLFKNHHASMDQDGYNTFDDPLLLFAQMENRMAVPVIVRLILNKGYTVTQPNAPENQSFLYEIYDPEFKAAYEAKVIEKDGNLANAYTQGTAPNRYGKDEKGNIIYETGMVKKAMKWLVLDMLNEDMVVLEGLDLGMVLPPVAVGGVSLPLETIINTVLGMSGVQQGIGNLLKNGLGNIVLEASHGAALNLAVYSDDNGHLNVSLARSNAKIGVLGYALQAWLESNNLLFAVINLIGARNTLIMFGAIGTVLVLIGLSIIEYTRKSKLALAKQKDEAKELEDIELAQTDNQMSFAFEGNTGSSVEGQNFAQETEVANNYEPITTAPIAEVAPVVEAAPIFYPEPATPAQPEPIHTVSFENDSVEIESEIFTAETIDEEHILGNGSSEQVVLEEVVKTEEIKKTATPMAKAKAAKPVAGNPSAVKKGVKPMAVKPVKKPTASKKTEE